MFLLTPPDMLLHLCPYAEIPKNPWNPMLYIVNPVNSEVTKSQPAQPEKPEAQVYGSKVEVWSYDYFLQDIWEKNCGYIVSIITHHGAFEKSP